MIYQTDVGYVKRSSGDLIQVVIILPQLTFVEQSSVFMAGQWLPIASGALSHTANPSNPHTPKGNTSTGLRILLPYYKGLSERIQRLRRTLNFSMCYKRGPNLHALLCGDEVRLPLNEHARVVYEVKCSCSATYIGETEFSLTRRAFACDSFTGRVKLFKRYVDDIFAIVKKGHEEAFLYHLNGLFTEHVKFTIEKEHGGRLPFLDALVIKDGHRLKTTVYRKPTNTDRYLNYHSHHPKSVKIGIVTGMLQAEGKSAEPRCKRMPLGRYNTPGFVVRKRQYGTASRGWAQNPASRNPGWVKILTGRKVGDLKNKTSPCAYFASVLFPLKPRKLKEHLTKVHPERSRENVAPTPVNYVTKSRTLCSVISSEARVEHDSLLAPYRISLMIARCGKLHNQGAVTYIASKISLSKAVVGSMRYCEQCFIILNQTYIASKISLSKDAM
ncbi:LOW QUALITY PROTEIN: hypothetical protein M514_20962 [Trichuris suis]|uniref:Uncharacterized protein n=1 Tax=Trichuris suis TaxID=68888 RepID=A0A085NBH2_9BILA|nr:LOW QUALITY PROTEIN: hypothetical protein M514_20962 [Trichuris suis]